MKKVNKTVARKAYDNGQKVVMNPCKLAFPNFWSTWSTICIVDKTHDYLSPADFDTIVKYFEYYNCTYETGCYAHFYIEEK